MDKINLLDSTNWRFNGLQCHGKGNHEEWLFDVFESFCASRDISGDDFRYTVEQKSAPGMQNDFFLKRTLTHVLCTPKQGQELVWDFYQQNKKKWGPMVISNQYIVEKERQGRLRTRDPLGTCAVTMEVSNAKSCQKEIEELLRMVENQPKKLQIAYTKQIKQALQRIKLALKRERSSRTQEKDDTQFMLANAFCQYWMRDKKQFKKGVLPQLVFSEDEHLYPRISTRNFAMYHDERQPPFRPGQEMDDYLRAMYKIRGDGGRVFLKQKGGEFKNLKAWTSWYNGQTRRWERRQRKTI